MKGARSIGFHASVDGIRTAGPLFSQICRAAGRPLVLRVFGGSLAELVEESPTTWGIPVRCAFAGNTVLLETKSMVRYFGERVPTARFHWYPNSRAACEHSTPRPTAALSMRVAYVGAVTAEKGIRVLVSAFRTLGIRNAELHLFGSLGPDLTVDELAAPGVSFDGPVSPSAVVDLLRSFDALVVPSLRRNEGYPGVIIEAFAAGTAVVASRIGGIPEMIEHGANGLLVPPGSAQHLGAALRSVLLNSVVRQTLQAGAAESAALYDRKAWSNYYRLTVLPSLTGRT